jgi:hypothetical protein
MHTVSASILIPIIFMPTQDRRISGPLPTSPVSKRVRRGSLFPTNIDLHQLTLNNPTADSLDRIHLYGSYIDDRDTRWQISRNLWVSQSCPLWQHHILWCPCHCGILSYSSNSFTHPRNSHRHRRGYPFHSRKYWYVCRPCRSRGSHK